MKRIFLLNLLLPAPVATTLYLGGLGLVSLGFMLSENDWSLIKVSELFAVIGLILLYAYFFAGLPSLLFAALLHRLYRTNPPDSPRALLNSSLGGLLSGCAIGILFNGVGVLIFGPLGLATGWLVGLTVRRFYCKIAHDL